MTDLEQLQIKLVAAQVNESYYKTIAEKAQQERDDYCRSFAAETKRWKRLAERAARNARSILEYWQEGFGSESDYMKRLEEVEREISKNTL